MSESDKHSNATPDRCHWGASSLISLAGAAVSISFVARQSFRDKAFFTTSILLSRQKMVLSCLSRQKLCLWQLPLKSVTVLVILYVELPRTSRRISESTNRFTINLHFANKFIINLHLTNRFTIKLHFTNMFTIKLHFTNMFIIKLHFTNRFSIIYISLTDLP